MKKIIVLLTFALCFNFITPTVSKAAATNYSTIKELKKIKKLAASGKTLNSGSLKLNSPYEKFYKKFGKPVYTFTPQGAAFVDHFSNGIKISTEGDFNIYTGSLKRIKKSPVKNISMVYKVDYAHIKKVFGAKKSLSYVGGDYFITYKIGKNYVSFDLGDMYKDNQSNSTLYGYTMFSEYSVYNRN